MTQEHPITPPPQLVLHWINSEEAQMYEDWVAIQAARWGADQELMACINWLYENGWGQAVDGLRAARRPKPPSKEEALDELHISFDRGYLKKEAADIIRRALESLPD